MPATKKVGTQLLVPEYMRERVQALALVRSESVAEVYRSLIEAQLPVMERAHRGKLDLLELVAAKVGGKRADVLNAITDQRLRFADLFDADGAPLAVLPARIG